MCYDQGGYCELGVMVSLRTRVCYRYIKGSLQRCSLVFIGLFIIIHTVIPHLNFFGIFSSVCFLPQSVDVCTTINTRINDIVYVV